MDLSHFELLFKPQSPAQVNNTGPVATVIQGYFLTITNLEDEPYLYQLDFIAPEPQPADANRSLAGNTLVFIDLPSGDNSERVLTGANGRYRLSNGLLAIPPKASALVAVLPSAFPSDRDPTPLAGPFFEVRGYVRLRLPAVATTLFGKTTKQSDTPVKVFVTAQNRATYFNAGGEITDQTQASVPLCGGEACLELEPEGPLKLKPAVPLDKFLAADAASDIGPITELISGGDDEEFTGGMARMLAAFDLEGSDLEAFNAALAEAGVGVALKPQAKGENQG